jgi:hypothetical protein
VTVRARAVSASLQAYGTSRFQPVEKASEFSKGDAATDTKMPMHYSPTFGRRRVITVHSESQSPIILLPCERAVPQGR